MRDMKNDIKVKILHAVSVTIFIICIIIGRLSFESIGAKEGNQPTMAGGISFIAWSWRGIYGALLTILFSKYVLQSKISTTRKILVVLMIVIFNLPIMFFMELVVFFPLAALIIVTIVNLITFLPVIIFKS